MSLEKNDDEISINKKKNPCNGRAWLQGIHGDVSCPLCEAGHKPVIFDYIDVPLTNPPGHYWRVKPEVYEELKKLAQNYVYFSSR